LILRLELVPSRRLAAAIVIAHAAAAAAVLAVLDGFAGVLLAVALLALGAAAARSRALLRAGASVRSIELGGPLPVFRLAGGEALPAAVGARRYVSRLLVTLPLARPLGRTLLVTADMLGPAEFRRLRIWALWNRLPGVAAPQLPA
jgi:hypothetical protein